MGASGADLLLSPAAKKLFPFYVECKNVESLNIHRAIGQATTGAQKHQGVTPAVVFRKNSTPAYVAIRLDEFLALLRRSHGGE